ncbi:hypothetical protein [Sagittula stellata]|uniref:Uncharacterized protein n=1 Tax=Sagittula stellata (strain ATCC 700073 / DSM 11524 / E-37) TaxID=388399 RepID=A3K3V9_SAGS3|nr:hypothetical protein [Sagittula stellata]EBA08223.1 hypothetical protein SSE37_11784 [Sagittula stellata E-37]
MTDRAGISLLGPNPLHVRRRIFLATAAGALAFLGLDIALQGRDGTGPLIAAFQLLSAAALYILVFRLVHPAMMRWLLARTRKGSTRRLSGFTRWYLGTGVNDTSSDPR